MIKTLNMTKYSKYLIILLISILACEKEDQNTNCNYLLDLGVSVSINMNLPQYSQLKFINNPIYIPNYGNGGLIVIKASEGFYRAWDASDPNQYPKTCSILEISGIEAVSGCDDNNTYSLITGQSVNTVLPCTLKEYPAVQSGNTVIINN